MVECETLCSRVGIMVNGFLKCIGTPQELKSKFGDGYRLKIRVSYEHQMNTKRLVEEKFPGAVLKVCIYVCMYIYMYVCIYMYDVCMYVCTVV